MGSLTQTTFVMPHILIGEIVFYKKTLINAADMVHTLTCQIANLVSTILQECLFLICAEAFTATSTVHSFRVKFIIHLYSTFYMTGMDLMCLKILTKDIHDHTYMTKIYTIQNTYKIG